MNELIPLVYDTRRTIMIMGEDGKDLPPQLINGTTDEESVSITLGKYSVTSTTGPSYVSKRVEAQESMLNMVNAVPATMAVSLDKIVENSDWPGSAEIAARLRTQLPPGVLSPEDLTPEEQTQADQVKEIQAATQERDDAALQADLQVKQASAFQSQALGQQALANAAKTYSEVGIKAAEAATKVDDVETKQLFELIGILQNTVTPNSTPPETQ